MIIKEEGKIFNCENSLASTEIHQVRQLVTQVSPGGMSGKPIITADNIIKPGVQHLFLNGYSSPD